MRIGVFGGTYDPIHVGHVVVATWVRDALALDAVWLMVAGDQWQKRGKIVASPEDRLAMARAAVEGLDGVEVSSVEIDRRRPSYTDETLDALAEVHPTAEWFLILGADAARNTGTWHKVERVQGQCTLVVVSRGDDPGEPWNPEAWRWTRVEIPSIEVSSTMLRERLRDGKPVDGLVPLGAMSIISERGLYRGAQ